MLTITPAASEAITTILRSGPQTAGCGLRLARGPMEQEQVPIGLTIVEQPSGGDAVISLPTGADVFVEPETAQMLDGQELDAVIAGDEVTFSLQPRDLDGGADPS